MRMKDTSDGDRCRYNAASVDVCVAAGPRQPKAVLIIDDNSTIRGILGDFLEQKGFSVTLCADGISGIAQAAAGKYDVFLVDYNMEGLNGTVVARMLRAKLPGARIIGMSLEDRSKDFLAAGADAFLEKPFDVNRMIKLLNPRA